jgi:hypothetical protein
VALMRAGHAAIAVVEVAALGHVWACALRRRRDRWLPVAVAVLGAEGIGLVVGRGDCPLGPLKERCGDPVPLFQLVLPPRAAKAAVPFLAGVTVAGLLALVARRPPAVKGLTAPGLAERGGHGAAHGLAHAPADLGRR